MVIVTAFVGSPEDGRSPGAGEPCDDWRASVQSAALHVLKIKRNPHNSVRVVPAQVRLHEAVGHDASLFGVRTAVGKELNSEFDQCGRGNKWHERLLQGLVRQGVAVDAIGKVSVRLSVRLKRDFPRQTWLAEQGRAW